MSSSSSDISTLRRSYLSHSISDDFSQSPVTQQSQLQELYEGGSEPEVSNKMCIQWISQTAAMPLFWLYRSTLSYPKVGARPSLGWIALMLTLTKVVEHSIRMISLAVTRRLQSIRESVQSGKAPEDLENRLYMFIQPYVWVMSPEMQLNGTGDAIVARRVRRPPPGSHDPTIKNLQWGDSTRGMIEAIDRASTYPFLTDGDANITEGSGFNVCFIKDRTLYTADRGVLEGITRKSVFDAARVNDTETRVEVLPLSLAYNCDEIFMCTTVGGVMSTASLDGRPVKDGKVGPVTKAIWDEYWAMHRNERYSFAIDYNSELKSVKSANMKGVEAKTNGLTNGNRHVVTAT